MQNTFTNAILGGTFDHFHAGHKDFLSNALSQAEHITLGLTTETLYQQKPFAPLIEDYTIREENVQRFLQANNFSKKTAIVPLTSIYGTSLEEENIDAIFVTPETTATAEKINNDREKKGWQPMEIVIIPLKKGNDGETISSARIRKGEINRQGDNYLSLFLQKQEYQLPELLRDTLRIPIGDVISLKTEQATLQKNKMIIAIGDIITSSIKKIGLHPAITIFDFMSERKEITDHSILDNLPNPQYVVENKPAIITQEVVQTLQKALDMYFQTKESQNIFIRGEEDLLTLPSILLAPLDAIILYGQTKVGAIMVKVTEEKKEKVKKIMQRFV